MTTDSGAFHPRELSGAELDAVLAAADDDLMDYVKAAAEPTATLVTIMDGRPSHPAVCKQAAEATAVIKMRSMARALALRLDNDIDCAIALVHEIERADGRARMLVTALSGPGIRDARTVHNLASPVYHQVVEDANHLARDLADASRIAIDLMDRASVYADEIHGSAAEFSEVITRALNEITDLKPRLASACTLAIEVGRQIARPGQYVPAAKIADHARELGRTYDALRVRMRAALDDLHLAAVLNPARELVWIQADVSGVNLSGAAIDIEVLTDVIWTLETSWPEGMAEKVRARSEEIRPGVYKVRGPGSGKTDLARV